MERRRRGRHPRGDEVEPRAGDDQEAADAERQPGGPPPAPRADHGQRGQRRGERERDDVALGMIPHEGDPEQERVGRHSADRDDEAERGEPLRD
jgi:hypothetical protein